MAAADTELGFDHPNEDGVIPVTCVRVVQSEKGATAVVVAISITLLFGFVALAIDLSRLYGARNELKNTADAAAMAAAANLYVHDNSGTVNPNANTVALDAVNAMRNTGLTIDNPAPWTDLAANTGDIQHGHWSHSANRFYRTDVDVNSLPADFFDRTTAQLDNPATHDFVNAVMVRTRRQTNPITMTFARLFGIDDIITQRISVAWLGYAGSFSPWEIDNPLALCRDSIVDEDDKLTCSQGRMINSNNDTAMWSNFTQDSAPWEEGDTNCGDPSSANSLKDLIQPGGSCTYGGLNPDQVKLGFGVSTNEGMEQVVFDALKDCWLQATVDDPNQPGTEVPIDIAPADGRPDYPWKMTLLVIDCDNPGCNKVLGAVSLEVLWILRSQDSQYMDAPTRMWCESKEHTPHFWQCNSTSSDQAVRKACVNDFFNHFGLVKIDTTKNPPTVPATADTDWIKKSIYFRPDCDEQEPTGTVGGENYGILSQASVLVDHMRIDAHADVVLDNQP